METPQTIYAIQLDPAALSLIASFAQSRQLTTAAFATAEEFLQAYSPGAAGCVALDLGAAREEGLTTLEQFRRRGMLLPTVLLADAPSVALVVRAIQRGAASVVEKPPSREALEQALSDALRQEQTERRTRQLREEVVGRLASLTSGEREVLERLLTGMANKNIAAELGLGLRTVELRRSKILKKLGAGSLPEMVRLVMLAEPERLQDGD